ncbi:MAG: SpoIID/LytB domain-containing protein, partial [Patescibacteria group bacterium]
APPPTDLQAVRLSKMEPLVLKPNEEKTVSVLYMNVGKPAWKKRALILNNIVVATTGGAAASFTTPDWISPDKILQFDTGEVKSGQTEIYSIPLKAPATYGIYTIHFQLVVNDETIEGGGLDLPITVTDDGSLVAPTADIVPPDIMKEPKIKIGLYTTENPIEFISESFYKATDANGQDFGLIAAGEKASISFNEETGLYTLVLPAKTVETTSSIRIVPIQESSIFILANYNNRPRWNLDLNDNQFRGGLEVRYAPTGYLWVINDLLMEDYLKGLAEANNVSPPEFLKALMTAARSYANYHLNNPIKHQAGGFILDSENDQVYRGYGQEKRAPNIAAAVEATRGMIVTYKSEPVVTPFFGRSSGRTLSFKEVWGVNKPWLVSVKTPYDKGYKRWGHGVGLSAQDAIGRAKRGANWDDILKYYYRGTELQNMY